MCLAWFSPEVLTLEKIHFCRRVSFSNDFSSLLFHIVGVHSSTLHFEGSDPLVGDGFRKAKLPTFLPGRSETDIISGEPKNGFSFQVQIYKCLLFKTNISEDNLLLKPQADFSFYYIS